jgi:hypothetical protein
MKVNSLKDISTFLSDSFHAAKTSKMGPIIIKASEVALAVFALYTVANHCQAKKLCSKAVYRICTSSAVEEFIFRGAIQSLLIPFVQRNWTHKWQGENKEMGEKIFRIYATAVLFAGIHAFQSGPLMVKLTQVTFTFVGGVTLGYMQEYSHSLALPILAHGIHNLIVCLSLKRVITHTVALSCTVAWQAICYMSFSDWQELRGIGLI